MSEDNNNMVDLSTEKVQ